ncbi:unnamed protein product [Prunus armeniaca]
MLSINRAPWPSQVPLLEPSDITEEDHPGPRPSAHLFSANRLAPSMGSRLTISPYLLFTYETMNPPSPLAADGPILGLADRENPAVPPDTPRVETPGRQSTLEDRMEAL